jgi:hypothetical protein
MHCPHCNKPIWFKMEARDNGISVVMPYTPEQIADRIIKQKESEKNEKV